MPPKMKIKQKKKKKARVGDPDYEIPKRKYTPRKVTSVRYEKERIPEEKLENAIFTILTETTEKYSCYKDICTQLKEPPIPPPIPDCYVRIQYEARNCILNQDWTNFSRLLYLMIQNQKQNNDYRVCTFKYFLLALLHDPEVKDKEYLEAFLSSVFDCHTPAERRNFLREVSTLKKLENAAKQNKNLWLPIQVKLPEVEMDRINLEHAKNVRQLFLGQKRKVPNLHNKKAKKRYKKQ